MVLRPDCSLREIQQTMEESPEAPLRLDLNYLAKIKNKIVAERTRRNLNLNLGARIAQIQDKKKMIDARLWAEATNQRNPGVVRVMALEKLIKNDLDLLSSEMDAGIYPRELGTLRHGRERTLEDLLDEDRQNIITQNAEPGPLQLPTGEGTAKDTGQTGEPSAIPAQRSAAPLLDK